jgi:competence protein ComEC
MASILADFKPQELWIGFGASNREMDRLLQEAERRRTPVVIRQAGDSFEFGGVTIRVLAPANSLGSQTHRQNDDTLVMKLTYRQTSALLEGDAEKPTERLIAQEHPEADLLKVAHHGSASSTSLDLLAAVRPRFALISVGANNVYGHPRIEVLQRLTDFRVATYRTDLQGAVTFYLDGKTVSARTAALR